MDIRGFFLTGTGSLRDVSSPATREPAATFTDTRTLRGLAH
jgi:hypothetical protein